MNIKRSFLLGLLRNVNALPVFVYKVLAISTLLLSAFFSTFYSVTSQAAPSIMLPDSSFDLQITPYLSIYEDISSQISITEILSPENQLKFTPSHSDNLRFSLSDSSYWLRFSIINPHANKQSLVFSISNSRLDSIEFYEYKAGKLNHQSSGGFAIDKAQGSHRQAYPFLIEVDAKKNQTYFIKIKSATAINTVLRLQSNDQFLQSQQFDFTVLGMALGWIVATGAFFVFIWYFYRFRIALISAFYCSSIFFFIPAWLGQWSTWFPHSQNWKKEIILISIMTSAILQTLITINLKWKTSGSNKVLRVLRGILALNIFTTLACLFLPSGAMILLMLGTIVITNTSLAGILLFAKSEYERAQQFLLFGQLIVGGGVLISSLKTQKIL